MTSDPPTTVDIFRLLRGLRAWSALVVPIVGGIATVLWFMHQSVQAQAVQIAESQIRLTHIEASLSKIAKMADDVAAIRVGLADERGWRRGLLQSLPGAEGED